MRSAAAAGECGPDSAARTVGGGLAASVPSAAGSAALQGGKQRVVLGDQQVMRSQDCQADSHCAAACLQAWRHWRLLQQRWASYKWTLSDGARPQRSCQAYYAASGQQLRERRLQQYHARAVQSTLCRAGYQLQVRHGQADVYQQQDPRQQ